MKTLGRFVLVDNATKKQMYLQWKTHATLNRTSHSKQTLPMSYSNRKNLISELKPLDQTEKQASTTRKLKQLRTSSSTNQLTQFFYSNPQRQITPSNPKTHTKTFYRSRSTTKPQHPPSSSSSPFSPSPFSNPSPKYPNQNTQKLRTAITQADKCKGKLICIFKMRREGLRFRSRHQFFIIKKQNNHEEFVKIVKERIFEEFGSIGDKKVYLFHLSNQPIYNVHAHIDAKEIVIFADITPKFSIPFDMQMRLFQQAAIVEEQVKINLASFQQLREQYGIEDQRKNIETQGFTYEWQKIKDIKKHVDKLVENPSQVKNIKPEQPKKDQVQIWYQQKYLSSQLPPQKPQKTSQKNPFFDIQSHFPNQCQHPQTLQHASTLLNTLPTTINRHQLKQRPIQNMMQKIKRQNQDALNSRNAQIDRIRNIGYKSEKQFLKELDQKNVILAYQNIPYIMEKYGITRAQAHNLYNLYKSLEKVSAMRLFQSNDYRRVKEKGIDRRTFDQGLKGLEINPGDEVIRNICYFPEFITWQQFIKIISISLRKTPKSKLQAILQGLGSTNKGYLTQQQIAIMVGSSLQKIFGSDQPQLKKYFVSVVMRELDKDRSGTIEIDQLKQHVLQKGIENLDLVSYLMLNS